MPSFRAAGLHATAAALLRGSRAARLSEQPFAEHLAFVRHADDCLETLHTELEVLLHVFARLFDPTQQLFFFCIYTLTVIILQEFVEAQDLPQSDIASAVRPPGCARSGRRHHPGAKLWRRVWRPRRTAS